VCSSDLVPKDQRCRCGKETPPYKSTQRNETTEKQGFFKKLFG